jgi:hypothetical protein
MSLRLDSRPLHGRGQGASGEKLARAAHVRWKPAREAEEKRRRRRRGDKDRAVEQKQLA